jgi:excisionase family DNA binding protein
METRFFTTVTETELREIIKQQVEEVIKTTSTPQPVNNELLTRKQVADLLGISLVTLHDWTKRGIVPALRIGTRIRFKQVDVMAALQEIETIKYRRKKYEKPDMFNKEDICNS